MAAPLRTARGGTFLRVFALSCSQQRLLSTGRRFLPRPRPIPLLLATGGGYLGYQHYIRRGPQEEGAPPHLATPTQEPGQQTVRMLLSVSLAVREQPIGRCRAAWTACGVDLDWN
ncbi:unnamed protein product [Pleuronectes platessa]|uniref:Uncharacterized protein n=1 Tax=Pleuronectes platessa TaxID=8262 RepID=A0A9N7Y7S1_PLEPL|nr:unnamed protein product [Pleuronectes platessa]